MPQARFDLTFLQLVSLSHQLFCPDSKFILSPSVVSICNNSRKDPIVAMIPACNTHGVDPTWRSPENEDVQAWFENLTEARIIDKGQMMHAPTEAELKFMVQRATKPGLITSRSSSRAAMHDEEEEEDDNQEERDEESPAYYQQEELAGVAGTGVSEVTMELELTDPLVHDVPKRVCVLRRLT